MIEARDLYRKLLLRAVSLVATFNRPGTGCALQKHLLRAMGVQIAGPVSVGPNPLILEPHNLRLGRYVSIGSSAKIACWAPVTIGDDFLAPDDLIINSGGHDPITLRPINQPVCIGARVWCGARVTIGAGVTVGDDAVIGAGAVVVRSVEPNTVVAGVPARPLRTIQRGPEPLWSVWAERSGFHDYASRSPLARLLIRLRQQL